MLRIEDGVFYLTKGDSANLKVTLKTATGADYVMANGDRLKLTVADSTASTATVRMTLISNNTTFHIAPSNTDHIPVGQYSCDIQLTTSEGNVYTIFPNFENPGKLKSDVNWANFWITPEVSR